MNEQTKLTLNELTLWEHMVFLYDEPFLAKFCHGGAELVGVYWSAERMKVYYFIDDSQIVTDSIPMSEWLEWYFNCIGEGPAPEI